MSDLISRSALLDDMEKELVKAVNDEDMTEDECKVLMTSALALREFVNRQPTVEAVPVMHAEWVPQNEARTFFMCSKCGSKNYGGHEKFCPNCGCYMERVK